MLNEKFMCEVYYTTVNPFVTSGTYMSHLKESFQVRWDNTIPLHSSIAHSIICTGLFRGKMHSDWFSGIEILKSRWQHGEKVVYCYSSRLEKTLFKWDIYVLLVMKGLILSCTLIFYTALFLYTTSLCLVKVI
jgi:CHASE2 domain-containing sensor protein